MLEKDIVKAILKYLKTVPNCFSWKEHGGMYGTAGIPDIICCYCYLLLLRKICRFRGKDRNRKAYKAARSNNTKNQRSKGTSLQSNKC